jgi:deoxycytidylate deaminase
MSANPQQRPLNPSKVSATGHIDFAGRESQELIIGFSGAIGCGMASVTPVVTTLLENAGYTVKHLKLSKIIERMLDTGQIPEWNEALIADSNRYEKLQLAGNKLRSKIRADFLAEISIAVISMLRLRELSEGSTPKSAAVTESIPSRTAYLVDQLKHPDEVRLLRTVYGNLFYLIGVLTGEGQRRKNLSAELTAQQVTSVMVRDRQDEDDSGQQLDKTLKHADFFLRNNHQNKEALEKPLSRFLDLIHGKTARTPFKAEYAMYAAFSASLKSACLSRQVGASITDEEGTVISTGCNDVPKALGGLYSAEDGADDHRCINLAGGKCFNDEHKTKLTQAIANILISNSIDKLLAEKIAAQIKSETRLKDLLEFSRSVHAEMDALVSIARRGGDSVARGSLYTTTFPCHNCARHIVAAGIAKVFYIEPYEKSLALELHDDAIISEIEDATSTKVQFLHFEGVAPRKYQELFNNVVERKVNGVARDFNSRTAAKTQVQYLDGYRDLEAKVTQYLNDSGYTPEKIVELTEPEAASS